MKTKILIMSVLFCTFCAFSVRAQNNDSANNQTKEKVYDVVEQMPAFPDGTNGLTKWLQTELKYPEVAAKKGISGEVYVSFTVDSDGTIKDIVIAKSSDPVFNREAVRVVESMPKWIPGKEGGKDVAVRFVLPIRFNIKK